MNIVESKIRGSISIPIVFCCHIVSTMSLIERVKIGKIDCNPVGNRFVLCLAYYVTTARHTQTHKDMPERGEKKINERMFSEFILGGEVEAASFAFRLHARKLIVLHLLAGCPPTEEEQIRA